MPLLSEPLTSAVVLRFPQRLFLFYARQRRGMTLGVRAAVFDEEGRVFLVKHSYTPGWHFPGGGVEPGETVHQALDRELMEEGGIRLNAAPELFGLYLNNTAPRRDHVAFFVSGSCTQVKPPSLPNFEIVDCRFFPQDALPGDMSAGTRRRLAEISGEPRSAEW